MRILYTIVFVLFSGGFISQEVKVSHTSGVFNDAIEVTITGAEKIYYTTDGSTPSHGSKHYREPIKIDKNTFLRIKAEVNGKDTVVSRSYLFNFSTKFPILSIGINEEDLWNDTTGIYALGKYARKDSTGHWNNANYQKKWEREVAMIYLDTAKVEQLNQRCGIRIFGESTRRQPDKSMKLIARSEYGVSRFNYRLFPQKEISEFKQLVIRTSGNDYQNTRFKDVLNTYLARNLGFDYMAYQPIQLFVNGEHWGVYNLREKINEHYLYENHGADKDSSSIIMGRWVRQHGSASDYMKMYNWFMKLDTMDDESYKKAQTMLDTRNYINYRAFQVFVNNSDSRGNVRYWNSKDQDGKFRMIMYDTDLGFGNASRKYLEACLSEERTEWFNPEWSTLYFRKLMQNEQFKNDFVNQLAHFMNTCLHRDTIIAAVDYFENVYKDELPRNGSKLAPHLKKVPIPMEEWLENVDDFRMFGKLRYKRLRPEITRLLAPKGEFLLNITGENGKIEINNNYALKTPFSGVYFKEIPLPVKAINHGNWHFTKWSDGDTSAVKIIETKNDTVSIQPEYEYVQPLEVKDEVETKKKVETFVKESSSENDVLLWLGYGLLMLGCVLLLLLGVLKLLRK